MHIYVLSQKYNTLKKIKNVKRFHFLTTSHEKRAKFCDFRLGNYIWMEPVAKNSCNYRNQLNKNAFFGNQLRKICNFCRFSTKKLLVCSINFEKNHTFKIVSREKSVNFANFRQSNSILMQLVAKKSTVQNVSCIKARYIGN